MELYDILLPVPFVEEQEVTTPGDLPMVRGDESLRRWILRCLTTLPGELLHRPQFGVGVQEEVDRPLTQAATRIANRARAAIRRDRRVRDVVVYVGQDRINPRRLDVEAVVKTLDDTTVSARTAIEIGL